MIRIHCLGNYLFFSKNLFTLIHLSYQYTRDRYHVHTNFHPSFWTRHLSCDLPSCASLWMFILFLCSHHKSGIPFTNDMSHHYIPSTHCAQTMVNAHHTSSPFAHRNLITARYSQFQDNRGIGKSIFEHIYSVNDIVIRREYFCTIFIYPRQHLPGITAHQCYHSTN